MKLVLLTPGTGSYHCGVCMRDNALARELIRQGHDAMVLPMYLPLTLDEEAASPGMPIFFGGVSTYLREKVPLLRHMPRWLDRLLSQRFLLRLLAGGASAKTSGPDVAEMTLSMLRGESGHQAAEINELIGWLRNHGQPEALWLSTALQAGLARKIKAQLGIPVIGFLQGEDAFIDGLGQPWADQAWGLLGERMRDADLWIAPSQYFADLMTRRLGWSEDEGARRIRVLPNGISLDGYSETPAIPPAAPTIGYLARFIPEKGIGILVEGFIELKKRGRVPDAKLRCAGSMTPDDARYVKSLRERLAGAGVADDVEWLPNVSRAEKIAFLESLTIFSVPAGYSEAFGMYVIEALAAGVPTVLPRASAFPEIIEATGGGMLYEPTRGETANGQRLALALEALLENRALGVALGRKGAEVVRREYSIERFARRLATMAAEMIDAAQVAP